MSYAFAPGPDAQNDDAEDVVGIIVRNRVPAAAGSRTLTFAWGPDVQAAPSLPFGRWKPSTRAA